MGLELHFHGPMFEYHGGSVNEPLEEAAEAVDTDGGGSPPVAGIGALVAVLVLVAIAFLARRRSGTSDADED